MDKCAFDPIQIKPDGVHELSPHIFEDVELYKNVTVIVSRCKHCGKIEIGWFRQDDTETIIKED